MKNKVLFTYNKPVKSGDFFVRMIRITPVGLMFHTDKGLVIKQDNNETYTEKSLLDILK